MTRDVLRAQFDRLEAEESAKKASRTSSERRMHPENGLPLNLFELLKSDPRADGFELGKIFFLELEHGRMALFPAIFSEDERRIVLTSDLNVLEHVWEVLEPRRANVVSRVAYVNTASGWAYLDAERQHEREERDPVQLLRSVEEFSQLMNAQTCPFRWAPGLYGGSQMDMRSYIQHMQESARLADPSFRSANPAI